jgi:hypothetical protein
MVSLASGVIVFFLHTTIDNLNENLTLRQLFVDSIVLNPGHLLVTINIDHQIVRF